ncbi:uncharacterized protein VNE69_02151 [Vairimorpha necatrix]|uniref:Uncharacterized protein n=1 Tax=Vairimorpha necatrix TaxID=6039 RepID=A0AAX4J9N7_9MICR
MFLFAVILKDTICSFYCDEVYSQSQNRIYFQDETFIGENNLGNNDYVRISSNRDNEKIDENIKTPQDFYVDRINDTNNFEGYKEAVRYKKCQILPDLIDMEITKLNNKAILTRQLQQLSGILSRIKEECQLHFRKKPDYAVNIIFNKIDSHEISKLRHYFGNFFLYYRHIVSYHIFNIEKNLTKIKFPDKELILLILKFVDSVFSFLLLKKDNIKIKTCSLFLFYKYSLANWKIIMVMNTINLPDLIDSAFKYYISQINIANNPEKKILEDFIFLKKKFDHIYEQKEILSSRLYELCQIISKYHMELF